MDNSHAEESTKEITSHREATDDAYAQKNSHVFQCMQCDLQFQADTVIVSHAGLQKEEEQLVHLRLPEGISPTQKAIAERMYDHSEEGRTSMTRFTQPLREEHIELLPSIEQLRTVADTIGIVSIESIREGVDEVYTFLTQHLAPHAQAEERALYPTVGRLMGAAEATATMSHEHTAIHRYIRELGEFRERLPHASLSQTEEQALRRILYGLYALVKEHFAEEEEVYLPLLDTRLTAQEALHMFEALEVAAQEAKRSVVH